MCDELPHEITLGDASLRKGRCMTDLTRNVLTWFSKRWHLRRHSQDCYTSIGHIAPETGSCEISQLIQRNSDCFSAKGERNGNCCTGSLRIETHRLQFVRTCIVCLYLTESESKKLRDDDIIRCDYLLCFDYRKLN